MKDRLFFGNTFCAVEHSFDSEGKDQFHCLQLSKKKNELVLSNSDSFDKISELFSYVKSIKQEHVVLVVNNNQVLSKSISVIEPNSDLVFKNAYPTLSIKDFQLQVAYSENDSWISIVRESYIKELIAGYAQNDIIILDVLLGNMSITSITEMIDYNELFTSNSRIVLGNNKLESIENKRFNSYSYNVNGIKIHNSYILPLAGIVEFYLKKNVHFKEEYLSNFKDKKVFNLGYKIALGAIFTMVLINFLFFSNYNKKVSALQEELEIKKGAKNKLKEISVSLDKKRKLLSELQNSSLFSVSKYTDQIVSEIPKSVILNEINYQPIKGNLREGKETQFQIKEIEVKGVLNEYAEFTSWIDAIERKKWVNQLLELSTEKDKRKRNSNFHIVIRLK